MKKLLLSIITVFAACGFAYAEEDVTFEALAPRVVSAGEVFRIEFVINAKPSEFIPPSIQGFEVLAGPQESHGTNIQIDGSGFTKVTTITYTYVLQGFTTGVITIPAAQATVKGKTYSTKPVAIEVAEGETRSGAGTSGSTQQQADGQQAGAGGSPTLAADDVFARVITSKSNVYKGEPIHVTLKLYARVPIGLDDLKYPSFNGFWSQDISGQAPVQQRESYNNKVYDTWVLKEYLLYPQQSGTLTIDAFNLDVIAQFRVQGGSPRNIFEELMGATGNIQQVNKKIASPAVKIDVKEWPSGAPGSFSGAVGQFTMDATPPQALMNANSSGTYSVRLSGTGNFPMIRAPKMELPTSFEEYTVTTSESTRHTRTGTTGYRQFEYPFIPRMDGSYTIPEFRFSYFDPKQERYITLSSHEVQMEVAADSTSRANASGGMVSGLSKEELKILGRDIHFIKTKSPNLLPKGKMLMWSPVWFSLMGLLVVLFFAALVLLRKYIRNMQNDKFVRGKRANKVALKRFRAAEASMRQGDKPGFYDEMLKALWGYMSDKLDIPMSSLTKDRIREELFERNVTGARADDYIKIISACEEAQYSPTSSSQMNELYKEGVNLVSELESAIKRK